MITYRLNNALSYELNNYPCQITVNMYAKSKVKTTVKSTGFTVVFLIISSKTEQG